LDLGFQNFEDLFRVVVSAIIESQQFSSWEDHCIGLLLIALFPNLRGLPQDLSAYRTLRGIEREDGGLDLSNKVHR
jgi:hypothetical protein